MQARQFLLPLETLIQSPTSRKSPIRVMGFRSENSAFAEKAVPILFEAVLSSTEGVSERPDAYSFLKR